MFPNCLHVFRPLFRFFLGGGTSCSPLRGSQNFPIFQFVTLNLLYDGEKVVRSTSQQSPALCLPVSCPLFTMQKSHIGRKITN